jgi:S23 ribosomal protein.
MAIYDNLPVYKKSYDLLLEVFILCKNLPRDHRFSTGERLKDRLMSLMVCIYHANSSVDKVEHLNKAREYVVEIKLYIRLLHDMKLISVKRIALLTENIESISKQLTAWTKSVRTNDITPRVPSAKH